MAIHRFGVGLGAALLACMALVACGDDSNDDGAGDADASTPGDTTDTQDAGAKDGSSGQDAAKQDSGTKDSGTDGDADADAKPPELPPGEIQDLAAKSKSHVSVLLTWTSPKGVTTEYDVRMSSSAITSEAEFLAATALTPPGPLGEGQQQTMTVTELTPETTYHFAVRAKDDGGVLHDVSNDAVATTSGRAQVLVSEFATANTAVEGGNFVELVATKAGSVSGLQVTAQYDGALLYTLGDLDVTVGDRIVVNLTGLPGPTNFVQEDETGDKTSSKAANNSQGAFDVYSSATALPLAGAIAVMDGADYMDAVAFANRMDPDNDDKINLIYSAYLPELQGQWTMSRPFDDPDQTRCQVMFDTVNTSGNSSPDCGGWPGFVAPGMSVQRNGLVDTNSYADFFSAPQTRGAENATYCPPETASASISEINPRAGLVELNVKTGGRLRGFTLRTNAQAEVGTGSGTELYSLPDVCASTGDVVVLHLGTTTTPTETTAKNQHLHATYAAYYDTAWDFPVTGTLTYASAVTLSVRNPANAFIDAAAFSDQATATTGDYVASLRWLQGANLWLPLNCGGALCGNATVPTARQVAIDWSAVDTTTSTSAKRVTVGFPSQASAWSVGAASFGQ